MFGDRSPYEFQIRELLRTMSMEEILELLNITEERVLEILLEGGHATLPPFLEEIDDDIQSVD